MALDAVWTPEPTERHGALVEQMLRAALSHRRLTDAHLAALAVEHGLTLCTADSILAASPA